jgi:hypothetical protein
MLLLGLIFLKNLDVMLSLSKHDSGFGAMNHASTGSA